MTQKLKFLFLTFVLLFTFPAIANTVFQKKEITIEGILTDNYNDFVIGADIVLIHKLSGKEYTTVSGLDGSYNLIVYEKGDYDLHVSYFGYESISVLITVYIITKIITKI